MPKFRSYRDVTTMPLVRDAPAVSMSATQILIQQTVILPHHLWITAPICPCELNCGMICELDLGLISFAASASGSFHSEPPGWIADESASGDAPGLSKYKAWVLKELVGSRCEHTIKAVFGFNIFTGEEENYAYGPMEMTVYPDGAGIVTINRSGSGTPNMGSLLRSMSFPLKSAIGDYLGVVGGLPHGDDNAAVFVSDNAVQTMCVQSFTAPVSWWDT